jgi:hypothetical protein
VLKVRVHPKQSSIEAQEAVMERLREVRPFGIEMGVQPGGTGDGFAAESSGERPLDETGNGVIADAKFCREFAVRAMTTDASP